MNETALCQRFFLRLVPSAFGHRLRITCSIQGFFALFLVNNFINSINAFPHFGCDQFTPFSNLPRGHPLIRVIGKVWANNSLATSSSTWQTEDYYFNGKFYLKTLNPTMEALALYFMSVVFLMMSLREIPVVCEFFTGADPWELYLPDHQSLDSNQQYYH